MERMAFGSASLSLMISPFQSTMAVFSRRCPSRRPRPAQSRVASPAAAMPATSAVPVLQRGGEDAPTASRSLHARTTPKPALSPCIQVVEIDPHDQPRFDQDQIGDESPQQSMSGGLFRCPRFRWIQLRRPAIIGPMADSHSILEFQQRFPDEVRCAQFLFDRCWPDGFICPGCGGKRALRCRPAEPARTAAGR
jgi:hypothetical protein